MKRMRVISVLAIGLATAAALGSISNVVFYIEATNAQGTASHTVYANELTYNPTVHTWTWTLSGTVDLDSDVSNTIGTLSSATLTLCDEIKWSPRVNMNFAFSAGLLDVTSVHVRSPLVSFFYQPDTSTGKATTSFTLTNVDGNGPAVLQALQTGHGMDTVWYNSTTQPPAAPNGTEWAHLVSYLSVSNGGGTQTLSGKKPDAGFEAIADDVYNMSADVGFSLTARDRMSTNGTWVVQPEPTSLALLALPALLVLRRR